MKIHQNKYKNLYEVWWFAAQNRAKLQKRKINPPSNCKILANSIHQARIIFYGMMNKDYLIEIDSIVKIGTELDLNNSSE